MFVLGRSSSSTQPTFFDIRVKSTYKNLVVVRGSHYDSPSVMVSGDIVFSLPTEVTVKRVGLRLTGRYKLDFLEVLSQQNTTVSNPVKEESVVFDVVWDNLLLNPDGVIVKGASVPGTPTPPPPSSAATRRLMRTNAPASIQLPERGVSGTPFQNMSTPNGTSFVLPGGNYELPFKCILPGDVPETVEGLMAGSILYKFEAIIDRGSFKSPWTKYRYFRILRTLSSDNFSLSETISIGKSWPDKVQYEVSIPSRAVPIGGVTPINILLMPLCKGMKLGKIRAQLIQYYAFKGQTGDVYDDEQVVLDCTMSQMENTELDDKISIDSFIKVPTNLKKVTQDCDFRDDMIKVRHKLKLQINLINSTGHISELRANLPITLFISPNVEMSGRTIVLDKHGKIHFRKEEEKLFENSALMAATQAQTTNAINDTGAPPNYEQHVFDKMVFTDLHQAENGDYFDNNSSGPLMENAGQRLTPISHDVPSYNEAVENPAPVDEFTPSYEHE